MNLIPNPDALDFRTSSYSDRSNCVAVADVPGGTAVRDSKHPERGYLPFPGPEWVALLRTTRP
ncbi:MAG: DUF397 domain-containing protein [Nocardiopsis sp. BM-2018]|uniref:DUF397 domain-containing protein n=1 Tax=Nocardiopsis metallicus TaxID=179819 RepID=A0A840WS87_9ACTN|nr:DUF397 domain-containing protein [Nocardiopsis metallicus]MBB5494496.1 hypothetical protein [Nocardiopsis metallicus]QRN81462.1 MAG: DUF397 domain-containing protein [Nocardiopsis sp. BM-2018]